MDDDDSWSEMVDDLWTHFAQKVAAIAKNTVRPPESDGTLVPVSTICPTCRAPIEGFYSRCWACNQHLGSPYARDLADLVIPLSYAVKGAQYYNDLWSYKRDIPGPAAVERLRIMITLFGAHHWDCLIEQLGEVSLITSVPSGRGRSPHPLEAVRALLGNRAPIVNSTFVGQRRNDERASGLNPDDFDIPYRLGGHVLIVEDTWVRGNNAQALAVRAKLRGAKRVSILVLGRCLDPDRPSTKTWIDSQGLMSQQFDPMACPVGPPQTCSASWW